MSLFLGVDGAEVALHRLGIPLKAVVAVEISPVNMRSLLHHWWEETKQTGLQVEMDDVRQLNAN